MEDDYQQPTKFNMAIATLERINKILTYIDFISTMGDLIEWEKGLMTLRRSISSFIKDKELKEINKKLEILNNKVWICCYKRNKTTVIADEFSRVYNQLDDLTICMQKAMNTAGLLMPKSDDPRFALIN